MALGAEPGSCGRPGAGANITFITITGIIVGAAAAVGSGRFINSLFLEPGSLSRGDQGDYRDRASGLPQQWRATCLPGVHPDRSDDGIARRVITAARS